MGSTKVISFYFSNLSPSRDNLISKRRSGFMVSILSIWSHTLPTPKERKNYSTIIIIKKISAACQRSLFIYLFHNHQLKTSKQKKKPSKEALFSPSFNQESNHLLQKSAANRFYWILRRGFWEIDQKHNLQIEVLPGD